MKKLAKKLTLNLVMTHGKPQVNTDLFRIRPELTNSLQMQRSVIDGTNAYVYLESPQRHHKISCYI